MQRKQLEKFYNVRIYQTNHGYRVETPTGNCTLKYMSDVERYLEKKYSEEDMVGDSK